MKPEDIREWMALELFGELDDDERRALEARLAESEELRAFRTELDRGLGVLARHAMAEARFEADFRLGERRLEEILDAGSPDRRLAKVLRMTAAFAAGLLFAWLVPLGLRGGDTPSIRPSGETGLLASSFAMDAPPPPATPAGFLARPLVLDRR